MPLDPNHDLATLVGDHSLTGHPLIGSGLGTKVGILRENSEEDDFGEDYLVGDWFKHNFVPLTYKKGGTPGRPPPRHPSSGIRSDNAPDDTGVLLMHLALTTQPVAPELETIPDRFTSKDETTCEELTTPILRPKRGEPETLEGRGVLTDFLQVVDNHATVIIRDELNRSGHVSFYANRGPQADQKNVIDVRWNHVLTYLDAEGPPPEDKRTPEQKLEDEYKAMGAYQKSDGQWYVINEEGREIPVTIIGHSSAFEEGGTGERKRSTKRGILLGIRCDAPIGLDEAKKGNPLAYDELPGVRLFTPGALIATSPQNLYGIGHLTREPDLGVWRPIVPLIYGLLDDGKQPTPDPEPGPGQPDPGGGGTGPRNPPKPPDSPETPPQKKTGKTGPGLGLPGGRQRGTPEEPTDPSGRRPQDIPEGEKKKGGKKKTSKDTNPTPCNKKPPRAPKRGGLQPPDTGATPDGDRTPADDLIDEIERGTTGGRRGGRLLPPDDGDTPGRTEPAPGIPEEEHPSGFGRDPEPVGDTGGEKPTGTMHPPGYEPYPETDETPEDRERREREEERKEREREEREERKQFEKEQAASDERARRAREDAERRREIDPTEPQPTGGVTDPGADPESVPEGRLLPGTDEEDPAQSDPIDPNEHPTNEAWPSPNISTAPYPGTAAAWEHPDSGFAGVRPERPYAYTQEMDQRVRLGGGLFAYDAPLVPEGGVALIDERDFVPGQSFPEVLTYFADKYNQMVSLVNERFPFSTNAIRSGGLHLSNQFDFPNIAMFRLGDMIIFKGVPHVVSLDGKGNVGWSPLTPDRLPEKILGRGKVDEEIKIKFFSSKHEYTKLPEFGWNDARSVLELKGADLELVADVFIYDKDSIKIPVGKQTAEANAIPRAGSDSKLDKGWLQEVLKFSDLSDVAVGIDDAAQGAVVYKDGATSFSALDPTGHSGKFLKSAGAGANPSWAALAKADLPSAIAYEDEANIYTGTNDFSGGHLVLRTGTFAALDSALPANGIGVATDRDIVMIGTGGA